MDEFALVAGALACGAFAVNFFTATPVVGQAVLFPIYLLGVLPYQYTLTDDALRYRLGPLFIAGGGILGFFLNRGLGVGALIPPVNLAPSEGSRPFANPFPLSALLFIALTGTSVFALRQFAVSSLFNLAGTSLGGLVFFLCWLAAWIMPAGVKRTEKEAFVTLDPLTAAYHLTLIAAVGGGVLVFLYLEISLGGIGLSASVITLIAYAVLLMLLLIGLEYMLPTLDVSVVQATGDRLWHGLRVYERSALGRPTRLAMFQFLVRIFTFASVYVSFLACFAYEVRTNERTLDDLFPRSSVAYLSYSVLGFSLITTSILYWISLTSQNVTAATETAPLLDTKEEEEEDDGGEEMTADADTMRKLNPISFP